jgi:hypothetical protein
MRKVTTGIFLAVAMGMLLSAISIQSAHFSSLKAAEPVRNHWRFHDGHWSYWDAVDNGWYYTDGVNWYWNAGEGPWTVYRFDRHFGRDDFERKDYRIPEEHAKVVVPHHGVYRVH